jgi:hypothetical protein
MSTHKVDYVYHNPRVVNGGKNCLGYPFLSLHGGGGKGWFLVELKPPLPTGAFLSHEGIGLPALQNPR